MPSRVHRLHAPFRLREELVAVCRRLADCQLIAGQDGNVSVRVGDDRLLVTPRRG
jgi:ribulose-5-phosphate 4-epimerase/fuculose-1-phosphate aldolase